MRLEPNERFVEAFENLLRDFSDMLYAFRILKLWG